MQSVIDALSDHGIEAHVVEKDDYVSVEVPCGEGADRDCHELILDIESWLAERSLPFVPEVIDGRVVIRPPGG
jgi:hypothetical protein